MISILCEITVVFPSYFPFSSLSLPLASFPFFFSWIYLDVLSNVNQFDLSNFPQRLLLRRQKLPNSCKGVDYFSLGLPFKVVQLLCGRKISRQRKQSKLEIHTRPRSTHQTVEQDMPCPDSRKWHIYFLIKAPFTGQVVLPERSLCCPKKILFLNDTKDSLLSEALSCLWHIEIIII